MVKKNLTLTALLGASLAGSTQGAMISLYNPEDEYVDVANADSSRYIRLSSSQSVERAFKSNPNFVTDSFNLSRLGNIIAISDAQNGAGVGDNNGFYFLRENGEFDGYDLNESGSLNELNLTLDPITHNGGTTFVGGGSVRGGNDDLFAALTDNNFLGIYSVIDGSQVWKGDLSSIVTSGYSAKDIEVETLSEMGVANIIIKEFNSNTESYNVLDPKSLQLTAVPEPRTYGIGLGLAALALANYRRRK